ncbi:unnamed protein product, partial [Pleuronectes platessa]
LLKLSNFTDMSSASCLLSEERLLCSICLDVFTDPVLIPCGHNFCSKCINTYWDSRDTCQCPMCNEKFSTRPELRINTFISELADEFKKLVPVKASTPGPQLPAVDVLCDICSEIKEKAVKSCLTCLTSFCESHLEPHQRVAGLKGHTLSEPVKNLDDRMCKTHNKMTELYCLKEQAFICVLCLKADHKGHNAVPLEEQYEQVAATKDEAQANIQKLIQTRIEKIAEVEKLLDVSQVDSAKEKQATVQVFTELIQSIQASQAELVEAIEQRHSAIKQKGEEFLKELRREVTELKSRSSQLEHLSQSEDHYHFLQSFQTLSKPPHKSCPDTDLCPDLSFQATRGHLTRLKQRVDEIMEEIPEIRMKRMREHAVDLTLDPDTAFYSLVISEDGKQVTEEDNIEEDEVTDNPKRFDICCEVLAKEGFTTGKFYFEVQTQSQSQCGHNFCSTCINTYWDSGDTCQCPMCKREFSTRPELQVNTFMSELADEFKKLVQVKASTPGPQLPAVDVLCDICSEIKEKAVKSCLTCLTSFCESHLEPHRRVAGLKGHTLLEPVKNLDDRMCKTHNKMTELYCLKEQAFICVLCLKADHKGHNAVPLEEQYEKVAATKDEAQANIQKLIQTRIEKIAEVENYSMSAQVDSEKEKQATVQVFTELIQSIQASQAELVEAIEQRHSAIKQKGEEFLKELRREVTELKSRSSQLEHLSQSEDHYHFLQSFQTLSKPPHKSCPDTDLGPDLSFQATRGHLTRLKQRVEEIMEEIPEIRMKRMREHAVDLTLDPDTAFYSLVISEDGKQVTEKTTLKRTSYRQSKEI